MFWTREPDAINEIFELTTENRSKDKWLSVFLKRARHGDMEHELYCFMHGLPTKHAGSWMPDENKVSCANPQCQVLAIVWQKEVFSQAGRSWEERCRDECSICQEQRQRRCRVLKRPQDHDILDAKFADAPLIHPWNAPKYHASFVRARLCARRTQQLLLWAIAEDTPTSSEIKKDKQKMKKMKTNNKQPCVLMSRALCFHVPGPVRKKE